MTGSFFELGPYLVMSSLKRNVEHFTLTKISSLWNRLFGFLFLDNPIGTGFSIASTYEEIPRDQENVAKHLSIARKMFISLLLVKVSIIFSFTKQPIFKNSIFNNSLRVNSLMSTKHHKIHQIPILSKFKHI